MKFIKAVFHYFTNLNHYTWADENGKPIKLLRTSWFYGFSIYPLVTYCYVDEVDNTNNKLSGLLCVTRLEFVSYMHTINKNKNT